MTKPSQQNQKYRVYKIVAFGYGLWIAINILITILQYSDTSIGAYLALLLTGFPTSLLSLLCTLDGSLHAVVLAGALGLAQWLGVTFLIVRRKTSTDD
jgi:hypothetical protein